MGPLHAARPGDRRRQDRHAGPERARRRVLHAADPLRRRALSGEQLRAIAGISRTSAATPPTSPTGRTSSCTGSASRTCPRSGSASRPSASSTTEACGDTPRVILGSPVAGIAADEIIDGTPAIEEIRATATSATPSSPTCRASSRPRSPARRSLDVAHEVERRLVRRRRPPRARTRVRRLGRRRAVDQPDVRAATRRLGPPRRGPRGLGRRHRDLPRLRLPPAAQPGPPEVPRRRLGRREVPRGPGERVPRSGPARRPGARAPAGHRRDHIGVHRQVDGRNWVGVSPVAGRVSGDVLTRVAELAETHGSGRVRLTTQQKLLVLDVPGRARSRPSRPDWPRSACPAGPPSSAVA